MQRASSPFSILSMMAIAAVGVLFSAFGAVAQMQSAPDPKPDNLLTFPRDVLEIETATDRVSLSVELALSPGHRQQGLMWRESLGNDEGMLFAFPRSQVLSFWMKNTLIPLDMIFANSAGEIVHIAYDAIPANLAGVSSQVPARLVLEVNAGQANAMGLQIGDQLIHPALPLAD